MKKSSKKTLAKRGVVVAGRALNPSGSQVHADKRKPQRSLQKQRLKIQLQQETARSRGPFSHLAVRTVCRFSWPGFGGHNR